MAKFIHTSDWHIGHQFHSYDRTPEHKHFFNRLTDIVRVEQPDALLISGDVFDSQIPSNSAMTHFTEGLHSIREAAPHMKVIVIAGNHDSASRLEISRVLWKHLNVEIIGSIRRLENGAIDFSRHVIPITDRTGSIAAYAIAIPYLSRGVYPTPFPEGIFTADERRDSFFEGLRNHLDNLRTTPSLPTASKDPPVVVLAHFTLAGCDATGHDRDVIGNIEAIEASHFPLDCDYLALGHIHRPQTHHPPGVSFTARYSGSAIPLSFDEGYSHGVTIVEIPTRHSAPRIREIDIEPLIPVVTLPPYPREAYTDFDELKRDVGEIRSRQYIRARLKVTDEAPANAYSEAVKAASGGEGRFCVLQIVRKNNSENEDEANILHSEDVESLRALSPTTLASRYYRALYGNELPDELREIFDECVVAATENEEDYTL